jgi:iduronate 2-sulfatase
MRRHAVTLALQFLATFLFAANAAEQPKLRPNVLFIAIDDLRTNLGCYGDKNAVTPNIDRLAQSGLLFERAYRQQAVCNPSRQSLLSGRRPDSIRVWNLADHFRKTAPDVVTLPEHFKNNGYFAQSFGKIFHGDKELNDPQSWSVPEQFAFAEKIEDYGEKPNQKEPKKNKAKMAAAKIANNTDADYPDGKVADAAIEALREFKSTGTNFFLALGFRKPHLPFSAPKKYWDIYSRDLIPAPQPVTAPKNVPPIALHDWVELRGYSDIEKQGPLTPEKIQELRHGYYAATSFMDAQVGKVLDELARLALDRNTIVVLWSDHGFHLGEFGLWCKASNFELDARVPLIVRTPEQKTAGKKSAALIELVDLYPTLVELCGLPQVSRLDGQSFAPLLNKPKQPWKEAAFTQFPRPWELKKAPQNMGYSVRTANFRYTEWVNFTTGEILARELYNLSSTDHELVNLAGDTQYRSEVERHSLLVQKIKTTHSN